MLSTALRYFFKIVDFSLKFAGAFPKRSEVDSKLKIVFWHRLWPLVITLIWRPMIYFILKKMYIHKLRNELKELFDIVHMFLIGLLALVMICIVQKTKQDFIEIMQLLENRFVSFESVKLNEFKIVLTVWTFLCVCFLLYLSNCVYYGELLVSLWIPFVNNDLPIPTTVYLVFWLYESIAAVFIFLAVGIWAPFILISTVIICKELDCLIQAFGRLRFGRAIEVFKYDAKIISGPALSYLAEDCNVFCTNKEDMRNFMRGVLTHLLMIKMTIFHVSNIHSYVFLVQTVIIVVHSCLLAFNFYITTHLVRLLFKSSPIILYSYFHLFAYCWNGQMFTDKCDKLFRALYRCPWYKCPHSFKTCLNIMSTVFKQPTSLSAAADIFPAVMKTFIKCLQESISYTLFLKAITSKK